MGCLLGFFGMIIVLGTAPLTMPATAVGAVVWWVLRTPCVHLRTVTQVLGTRSARLPPPSRPAPAVASGVPVAGLNFFYGPAMADLRQVNELIGRRCGTMFRGAGATVHDNFLTMSNGFGLVVTGPIGIALWLGLLIGYPVGLLLGALVQLAYVVVLVITLGTVHAVAGGLRAADTLWLRVRRIRMVCPHCYDPVPYPAYRCGTCGALHRDIRPGRYGVVHRVCRCGTRAPNLLLFGTSQRLNAVCPHPNCEKPLEHRPGEVAEIVLPYFGAAGAGKSRLLVGMVAVLRQIAGAEEATATRTDERSRALLRDTRRLLAPETVTAKTPVEPRRGYSLRITAGRGARLIHLFDAAGERFYLTARTQDLRFLAAARTFVLVIDPLSVEMYWSQLPTARQERLRVARSTAPSAELAYQQTHEQIAAMGVPLRRARLAVVLSKADLVGEPDGGADAEDWAVRELGLGNLVRSARQMFGEVMFFRTAAVNDSDGRPDDSLNTVVRWVLAGEGVRITGPSVAVGEETA